MCKFKSGIILKDRVFVPDYDSHTKMLEELGIEDTLKNAEKVFIRAELYPENGDVFSDIDTWKFNVDQDVLPDWYVKDYERQRMVDAVKLWAKRRIHQSEKDLVIGEGKGHYIKDCTVENICGRATVKNICDSATVENICGRATVKNICDSATVENIYGSATVSTSQYAIWEKQSETVLKDNAIIRDKKTMTIYHAGAWKAEIKEKTR